jgi:hypothetical protein
MNAEELGNKILALMAECNAQGIEGNTADPNGDPRLFEIGNLLTLFETFYHKQYVEFAYKHFVIEQ